jgi:hypothetical protein
LELTWFNFEFGGVNELANAVCRKTFCHRGSYVIYSFLGQSNLVSGSNTCDVSEISVQTAVWDYLRTCAEPEFLNF